MLLETASWPTGPSRPASADAELNSVFQFVGRIRRRFLRVHRFLGAVYSASATALGLTGLVLAPTAYTGLVAVLGFTFLDLAMLFTWTAVRMVVARRIGEHRRWMIRRFSLILAGVMLRLMTFTHAALTATGLTDMTLKRRTQGSPGCAGCRTSSSRCGSPAGLPNP